MAWSAANAMRCSSLLCNFPSNSSTSLPRNRSSPFSVSVRSNFRRSNRLSIRSSSASVSEAPAESLVPAISLTDNALKHLKRIRSERGEELCLRVGVKQGGCSGMSYTMDLESKDNARPDDSVIEHNGFTIGKLPSSLKP